jgi:hypothetical protein
MKIWDFSETTATFFTDISLIRILILLSRIYLIRWCVMARYCELGASECGGSQDGEATRRHHIPQGKRGGQACDFS